MRARVFVTAIALPFVALLPSATSVLACDCHYGEGPPACEAFWKTPVVFVGRVDSIVPIGEASETGPTHRVRFRVSEQFRGPDARKIDLLVSFSYCDLPFQRGQDWIVYASPRADGVGWTNGICSGSRLLKHAGPELEYARSAYSARSDKGRVFGRLTYARGHKIVVVPGITVAVSGTGWTPLSSITDSEGRYEVFVPAGNYAITAALPRGMTVRFNPIVSLADSRGCAEADLWAEYTGEATGRIIDHSGAAIPNLTLEVIRVDGFDSAFERLRTITNASGRFAVTGISIGSYRLGLLIGSDNEAPRFHYLGGAAGANGVPRFVVEGGETAALGSLTLPNAIRIAQIGGVVVNNDGQPQPGIKVRIKADVDSSDFPWTTIATDKQGRFAFALATGIRYRIVAEPWDAWSGSRRSVIVKIDPSKTDPLRIVLP